MELEERVANLEKDCQRLDEAVKGIWKFVTVVAVIFTLIHIFKSLGII